MSGIPMIEEALNMVFFYYSEVKKICGSKSDWPTSLEEFYKEHYKHAVVHYGTIHNNLLNADGEGCAV